MTLHSKKDIEKISFDILKQSKALDVFPTPIDKIIDYSDLILETGIDLASLEKKHTSFNFTETFKSGWEKIRGFLDRREKIIYIDSTQNENRQGFVKLHEVGHNVLPWQNATMQFFDNDDTLDLDIIEEFEAEANYFASITLFQNDRFENEVKKYELGLPTVMQLSKYFGASNHATFRRYVENSKQRCALLILEQLSPKGSVVNGKFRNAFYSKSFLENFGEVSWPEKFGYKWEFMKDHAFKRKHKLDGLISLPLENYSQNFNYHYFNNSYNVFVLIFPKGENKATKTKIILR